MFPMIVYSKTSENWQTSDIGDSTKSAVVFIVERLSPSQRFIMYYSYNLCNLLFGTSKSVLCREVYYVPTSEGPPLEVYSTSESYKDNIPIQCWKRCGLTCHSN